MERSVIYPGSFDPITKGHLDVIERSGEKFDKTIVGVGKNAEKKYMFTFPERVHLIQGAISKELKETMDIEIKPYSGLLVDFAKEQGVNTILRGIRGASDLDSESMLHWVGESQDLGIDTVFLLTKQDKMHISSSATKAILKEQGLIGDYVPLNVKHALEARMMGQYLFGVTGTIGAGKSYITDQFVKLGEKYHLPVHNIDLDKIGHKILGEYEEPGYVKLRNDMAKEFGQEILLPNGFVDRKALGAIVFQDEEKRKRLDDLLHDFLILGMRKELKGKKGILLLNGALLAEAGILKFANNNVVMVDVDPELQQQRLLGRGHTLEQAEKRVKSQYSGEMKEQIIHEEIKKESYGTLLQIQNDGNNEQEIDQLFHHMVASVDVFGELRIQSLLAKYGLKERFSELYADLKGKYDTPERLYHDWSHVVAGLDRLYEMKPDLDEESFEDLFFAILFHDVIYQVPSSSLDNERNSAAFAEETLQKIGFDQKRIETIKGLIFSQGESESSDFLKDVMNDIDLAILGQKWEEYSRYAKAVRFDYSYYSDEVYKQGRITFLEKMLGQQIYKTAYFSQRYESQAKLNMEKELALLKNS